MADPKPAVPLDDRCLSRPPFSEDELDWQENQRRSPRDLRRVDRAFLSGWVGLTGMWIALAIIASGAVGAVRVIAALAHH